MLVKLPVDIYSGVRDTVDYILFINVLIYLHCFLGESFAREKNDDDFIRHIRHHSFAFTSIDGFFRSLLLMSDLM
jgi:hypothetical protein